MKHTRVTTLTRRYRLLLRAYAFLLTMLCSTIASASTGQENTLTFGLLALAFLLTVPVLIRNYRLHLAIKEVDPNASSVGLANAVVSSLLFTPFEAAIVQPPFNLAIANRLRKRQERRSE